MRQGARQQIEQGRLAGAVGTNDRPHVACGNSEIHIVDGLKASETLSEADDPQR